MEEQVIHLEIEKKNNAYLEFTINTRVKTRTGCIIKVFKTNESIFPVL